MRKILCWWNFCLYQKLSARPTKMFGLCSSMWKILKQQLHGTQLFENKVHSMLRSISKKILFFYESLTKLDSWVDRHRIKVSKSYLNWNPSKSYRSSTHINPFRFAKQIAILCSMIRLVPLCTSPGAAAVKWHKGLSIASKGHFKAHSAYISPFIF